MYQLPGKKLTPSQLKTRYHLFLTGNKKQGNQKHRTLLCLIIFLICCRSVVNSLFPGRSLGGGGEMQDISLTIKLLLLIADSYWCYTFTYSCFHSQLPVRAIVGTTTPLYTSKLRIMLKHRWLTGRLLFRKSFRKSFCFMRWAYSPVFFSSSCECLPGCGPSYTSHCWCQHI